MRHLLPFVLTRLPSLHTYWNLETLADSCMSVSEGLLVAEQDIQ